MNSVENLVTSFIHTWKIEKKIVELNWIVYSYGNQSITFILSISEINKIISGTNIAYIHNYDDAILLLTGVYLTDKIIIGNKIIKKINISMKFLPKL